MPLSNIPAEWRMSVLIGTARCTLGPADIELIRAAAVHYLEQSNHPLRADFIAELNNQPAFVTQSGGGMIGFWAVENRNRRLTLTRYPQPDMYMTFYFLDLDRFEAGWRGVQLSEQPMTWDGVIE